MVEEKSDGKCVEQLKDTVTAPPPPPPPPELTQEEILEKQKCEKVFRKQEEEWMTKREKVSTKIKTFSLFFQKKK